MEEKDKCPVCGGDIEKSFDICEVCGWEYDPYQSEDPDDTGANGLLTLNEAKKLWEASDKNDPNFLVKYMRQGYCCSEGRCSMENLTIEEIEKRMDAENPETNPNGSETKFFEYALMGAKQGSAKCMAGLSLCYFMAYGTDFDEEEAIKWAEKGVAQGNDMAVFLRGTYYEYGNGIYQNFEKALTFYKMAAALDYPRAKGYLACMYADWICFHTDSKKAFKLWLEAYEGGEVWCSVHLFECYLYGIGTKKNLKKAKKYLKVAQKNNEEIDSNSIAKYENEIKMSKQIKPDETDEFLSDEEFAEEKKTPCPVCGGKIYGWECDICEICGWEYDSWDMDANGKLTLNEAKKIWEASDKKDSMLLRKYMELGYSAFEHDQMTGRRKK